MKKRGLKMEYEIEGGTVIHKCADRGICDFETSPDGVTTVRCRACGSLLSISEFVDFIRGENIQEDMLTKIGAGIKGMDTLRTEFTDLKTRYRIMGITLLIIALEKVKDKNRKKMLEDILEEIKLETKKP